MNTTKIEIAVQGVPVPTDEAWVVIRHEDIALVVLDIQTKWCVLGATSSVFDKSTSMYTPCVHISPTDRAMQLLADRDMTDDDMETEIAFPDFKDWDIAVSNCNRYTLSVCFTKLAGTNTEVIGPSTRPPSYRADFDGDK